MAAVRSDVHDAALQKTIYGHAELSVATEMEQTREGEPLIH